MFTPEKMLEVFFESIGSGRPLEYHTYKAMIKELEEEVSRGRLGLNYEMQVKYTEEGKNEYIDGYFKADKDLEDIFNSNNQRAVMMREEYLKSKPFLRNTSVENLLKKLKDGVSQLESL